MSIFRYFSDEKYAVAFVKTGSMLFRPLSYFEALENDTARGDVHEGKLRYRPRDGLKITKSDGTVITMEGREFRASAKTEDIFVYCFSDTMSVDLVDQFKSPFCVEIKDIEDITDRLKRRADRKSSIDYDHVLFDKVDYRDIEKEPDATWALPDKIAFIKDVQFAQQAELRIVLGKRGALDPENVQTSILGQGTAALTPANADKGFTIGIGDISHIAELHYF